MGNNVWQTAAKINKQICSLENEIIVIIIIIIAT